MTRSQSPPPGYHSVTPYLVLEDVGRFLDFARAALGAEVTESILLPDGGYAHAEIQVGDSRIMVGGAQAGQPAWPAMFYLYVPDTDAAHAQALAAGAESVREPADQFYGDRSGGVQDPFGNQWWFGTRVEEVSPEELQRRMAERES